MWIAVRTVIMILFIPAAFVYGDEPSCKWSNENCERDDQCCGGMCVRLHEGTNPRCAKSQLHGPCLAYYQCEDGLSCRMRYHTCCAPYWGICISSRDCCDFNHICREEDGFTYSRCLYPSSSMTLVPFLRTHIVAILVFVLF